MAPKTKCTISFDFLRTHTMIDYPTARDEYLPACPLILFVWEKSLERCRLDICRGKIQSSIVMIIFWKTFESARLTYLFFL